MTANTSSSEGTLTLTYPQVDRYFVTVILDSTAEGSGPAQFKVRTTVSGTERDVARDVPLNDRSLPRQQGGSELRVPRDVAF